MVLLYGGRIVFCDFDGRKIIKIRKGDERLYCPLFCNQVDSLYDYGKVI